MTLTSLHIDYIGGRDWGLVLDPILPRPYPDDLAVDWHRLPVLLLDVDSLVPTQQCVRLDRLAHLARGGEPEGDDTALHINSLAGDLLIHDGHTRWLLALIRGDRTLRCRVHEAGS